MFPDPGRSEPRLLADGAPEPVEAARRRILVDHRETVLGVIEAADAVAAEWSGAYATDRRAVVAPLERAIGNRTLEPALLAALAGAVEAAGFELSAEPVPAPPYLAITGTGPVLRATVSPGRVVVRLQVFGVERTPEGPRYVRRGSDPDAVVAVERRGVSSGGGDRP